MCINVLIVAVVMQHVDKAFVNCKWFFFGGGFFVVFFFFSLIQHIFFIISILHLWTIYLWVPGGTIYLMTYERTWWRLFKNRVIPIYRFYQNKWPWTIIFIYLYNKILNYEKIINGLSHIAVKHSTIIKKIYS
jgi:hypothetical protein